MRAQRGGGRAGYRRLRDTERVYDRVAAIDVAKDTGMVCTRTPHPSRPGARRSTVWTVLEACGLAVQLVNAAQARNLPATQETDKLDAMWLARLTEMGLLRASFVPPKAIRDLRDYTRMRTRLTQERTRCFQRMEKLLEGSLVELVERGQHADRHLRAGHDQGADQASATPARWPPWPAAG